MRTSRPHRTAHAEPRNAPSPRGRARVVVTVAAGATLALAGCSLAGGGSGSDGGDAQSDAASSGTSSGGSATGTITLVTHDSFALSDGILEAFTQETGYTVELVAPGDGGALVNQLILTKDSPLGDAVFGIDTTFASRAVNEGVLAVYVSPDAAAGFDDFDGHLTAIDQGDVCLNVDHVWFEENGVAEPTSFEDLLAPEYQNLTVLTNPSTSSPGLAFLLATIGHFGEDGWQQYWTDLLANGAKIDEGWSDAYYVDFSGSEGAGAYPIVLSYSSSPASTIGADGQPTTGNVDATCFRQVEYAGVLEGATNPERAQALIDYLLTDAVQDDIPGSMYMYPVSPTAEFPADWAEFAPLAADPVELDPALIAENRTTWLEEWLALVG